MLGLKGKKQAASTVIHHGKGPVRCSHWELTVPNSNLSSEIKEIDKTNTLNETSNKS